MWPWVKKQLGRYSEVCLIWCLQPSYRLRKAPDCTIDYDPQPGMASTRWFHYRQLWRLRHCVILCVSPTFSKTYTRARATPMLFRPTSREFKLCTPVFGGQHSRHAGIRNNMTIRHVRTWVALTNWNRKYILPSQNPCFGVLTIQSVARACHLSLFPPPKKPDLWSISQNPRAN